MNFKILLTWLFDNQYDSGQVEGTNIYHDDNSGDYEFIDSTEESLDIITWNIENFPKHSSTIDYVADFILSLDAGYVPMIFTFLFALLICDYLAIRLPLPLLALLVFPFTEIRKILINNMLLAFQSYLLPLPS